MTTIKKGITELPYRQIESDLRARCSRGEWKKGVLLPSRRALAQEYGVAIRTVERAISGLRADGILRADGRWGTYITGEGSGADQADSGPVSEVGGRFHKSHETVSAAVGSGLLSSSLPTTNALLGLLDTNSLVTHSPRRDEYGWLDVIASHAERVFAVAGGRTNYFSQFGEDGAVTVSAAVTDFVEQGVDALLVMGIFDGTARRQEVLSALLECPIPAVYVLGGDERTSIPHIFYDNRLAGGQAARHLRRCGYGDLVFFSPFQAPWAQERLAGMEDAQQGAVQVYPNISPVEERITDWERCRAEAAAVLEVCGNRSGPARPAGIVAANDIVAHLILDAAAEMGLKPGSDFGLVGFDDHPRSRTRGLTSLTPPLEALGEQAARVLLNRLRGDETEVQVRLCSHLLPRASTHISCS